MNNPKVHNDGNAGCRFGAASRHFLDSASPSHRERLPKVLGERFARGRIGQLGLNPALARRVETTLGEVWAIPGNGSIALSCGGLVATGTDVIARQGTLSWTAQNGTGIVHGLVPDGVSEVTLLDWNNTSVTVAVNENVYAATLRAHFQSLRFIGPAGTVELGPYR